MPRIIVGISGASGMPLARDMLEAMSAVPALSIHLVVSCGARRVMQTESGIAPDALSRYVSRTYAPDDMAAGPASGSWRHDGMVICPCSMSSLASIASGVGLNLIHRAADVTLKERRPLVLVTREAPLNLIHLKNMQAVTEAGGIVMPFSPAFYTNETGMPMLVRHFTGRVLDMLGIGHSLCARWRDDA